MNGYELASQDKNYGRAVAGSAMGQASGPLTAQGKPRLQQQLDQLDKVLSVCHEAAGGLEGCADRLTGSVAEKQAGNAATRPPSITVEQRLAESIAVTEYLLHRLNEAGARIAQAV